MGQIGFTNNGTWRMTTTHAYDNVNRLMEISSAPSGTNAGTYFCAYDGNGNVMALVSAADGSVAARYEYGPFGELIRATGPMALENPFGFSTKRRDAATGLVLYEYRVYSPDLGRWPNRDPLGDEAFLAFVSQGKSMALRRQLRWDGLQPSYVFVRNDPSDYHDLLGLNLGIPGTCGYGCIPPPDPTPTDPCLAAIKQVKGMLGDVVNDKRAHCVGSCMIAKACGKRVCKCLGTIKEARDLFAGGVEWVCSWVLPKSAEDFLQGGNIDASAEDFAANDWGIGIAKDGGDCVKECEARYGTEP